jgi:hypothetical protein
VPQGSKHIGFRVADAIADQINRASDGTSSGSRSSVVHEAVRRGLLLLGADAAPVISAPAAAAGRHQLRVSLSDKDAAHLQGLQERTTDGSGRPVVRVFVLRECLLRGLQEIARS